MSVLSVPLALEDSFRMLARFSRVFGLFDAFLIRIGTSFIGGFIPMFYPPL
jgi:hypothetical protein